jgi:hypothetical protein
MNKDPADEEKREETIQCSYLELVKMTLLGQLQLLKILVHLSH